MKAQLKSYKIMTFSWEWDFYLSVEEEKSGQAGNSKE